MNMGMSLKINTYSSFLHVEVTGEFSLPEAKRTFLEILEAATVNMLNKVLFDGRTLIGDPRTIERFCYGEFAATSVSKQIARGLPDDTHFAYVLELPMRDPMKFGETVAVNRACRSKYSATMKKPVPGLGSKIREVRGHPAN